MRNSFFRLAFAALAAAVTFAGASIASAQPYGNNPTYMPTPVLGATTLAAPGTVVFNTNNINTLDCRVSGTNTGVVGQFQITSERAGVPTWSSVDGYGIGSPAVSTVTGNGFWRVRTQGAAQARFNLTAISTGSIVVACSGSAGDGVLMDLPSRKATYSASITGLVAASAATDIFTINGSATKNIRVTRIQVSGRATAVAGADIQLVKRSAADTGGTSTAPTAVPNESTSAAASATLAAYTVNPTTGAAVGNVRTQQLYLGNLTTGVSGPPAVFTFGTQPFEQEILLSGAAQGLAVNLNGGTYSGNLIDIDIEWTED